MSHTPWSTVGYLTYKRTYARRIGEEDAGVTEEWPDTVARCIEATDTQLNCNLTDAEKERLTKYLLELKGSHAGRFLWQLGTSTVDKLGLPSLQNCDFAVVSSPVRPFTWTMDRLMLGCGVGYNIQRQYVYKLPPVKEDFELPIRQDDSSADFIIPDTREGWVNLLERVMSSAFHEKTQSGFTYSTQLIRGKGAPIKGFGGVASGPEVLCWGIEEISKVIKSREGEQLRPIDCLDIMNIIGEIVIAGNVRRSAQLAIGDMDDFDFLKAKNWSSGKIPKWRSNSNNSVVCNNIHKLPKEFWDTYEGGSEPYGLINIRLSRACGRIGDTQYKDRKVKGYNPCAEQSLEEWESCCLAEIFLPNIESKEELLDVAILLYKVNKHSLRLPDNASPETQAVVNRNMRMGVGVTGYLQATEEQRAWLSDTYEDLRNYDNWYSDLMGFPRSIKLTTIKPSGTLSLLPGVTPGVHPGYAQYMIRRIRMSSDNPLVEVCRSHGYNVEFQRRLDGTEDHSTVCVEFPMRFPEGTVVANDITPIEQLEYVKRLMHEWSDNSVSCTIYYKKEDLPEIKAYLEENYNKNFKSLSFLLHSDHGFDQAPYEEITKEQYDEMVAGTEIITEANVGVDFEQGDDCDGGMCPIK